MVKSVLKVSRFFCSSGFLLQIFQSSFNITVFNTRFYAVEVIFLGSRWLYKWLCSLYHHIFGQIAITLDDWGPILTSGIYHFLLDPPG